LLLVGKEYLTALGYSRSIQLYQGNDNGKKTVLFVQADFVFENKLSDKKYKINPSSETSTLKV
jgi:hypothetical protein